MSQFPDDDLPELIYSYSREDAVRDGVLVEVPEALLKEAGIKFRVSITCILFHDTITPDEASAACGQSVEGRLWDVLMVFRAVARGSDDDLLFFPVKILSDGREHRDVIIRAHIGPGDDGEAVITLMHEWED